MSESSYRHLKQSVILHDQSGNKKLEGKRTKYCYVIYIANKLQLIYFTIEWNLYVQSRRMHFESSEVILLLLLLTCFSVQHNSS